MSRSLSRITHLCRSEHLLPSSSIVHPILSYPIPSLDASVLLSTPPIMTRKLSRPVLVRLAEANITYLILTLQILVASLSPLPSSRLRPPGPSSVHCAPALVLDRMTVVLPCRPPCSGIVAIATFCCHYRYSPAVGVGPVFPCACLSNG
ncbi:hypothetical protein LY78DRAFT_422068 [Colletotrichum sublineola]|nr:hypothetical protein LY78DRAFT_422068 [Colletotrichum sublineola]